jgi:hypothetical protein
MLIKGFNDDSCGIAMQLAIKNMKSKGKYKCGLTESCLRKDKGRYKECGLSIIKDNTEEMMQEVKRRVGLSKKYSKK